MNRTILLPLKQPYEQADIEVLTADRMALEGIARAIMQDERLASLITIAFCKKHKMEMIPDGYMDEYRFPNGIKKGVKRLT